MHLRWSGIEGCGHFGNGFIFSSNIFSRFRHGRTKGCQCRCIASDLSKTLQYFPCPRFYSFKYRLRVNCRTVYIWLEDLWFQNPRTVYFRRPYIFDAKTMDLSLKDRIRLAHWSNILRETNFYFLTEIREHANKERTEREQKKFWSKNKNRTRTCKICLFFHPCYNLRFMRKLKRKPKTHVKS